MKHTNANGAAPLRTNVALVYKAWNLWMRDQRVQKLFVGQAEVAHLEPIGRSTCSPDPDRATALPSTAIR